MDVSTDTEMIPPSVGPVSVSRPVVSRATSVFLCDTCEVSSTAAAEVQASSPVVAVLGGVASVDVRSSATADSPLLPGGFVVAEPVWADLLVWITPGAGLSVVVSFRARVVA